MIEVSDLDLALEIVLRLNRLLEDPGVPEALATVMHSRISVDISIGDHSSLQVDVDERCAYLGWLGILNGIVGTISGGQRSGSGYIGAVVEADGTLTRFELVEP